MPESIHDPYKPPQSLGIDELESSTATQRQVEQGRFLVAVAIAVTLIGDGLVILLKLTRAGLQPTLSSFVRWLITAAIFYALWQGHRWARRLIAGLTGTGLVFVLMTITVNPPPLFLLLAAQFGITVALLVFPPSVSAFLREQPRAKEKQKGTRAKEGHGPFMC